MNVSVPWNLFDWFRVCAFVVNVGGLMIAAMANRNIAAKLIVVLIVFSPFQGLLFRSETLV